MNERLHLHKEGLPIRTVIFDFGGVLLNLNPDKCRKAFHDLGIHQIEEFIDRYRPKGLFFEAECGNIGQETFISELQKLAPRPTTREEKAVKKVMKKMKKMKNLILSMRLKNFGAII